MGTKVEAREKVTTMLTQGLGLRVTLDKDQDLMIETAGRDADDMSTSAFFDFEEIELKDGKRAYVQISAPMLRNVPESEELYKWIAVVGTGYRIGCVEAFPEENGTVFLRYKYSLLADYLDEEELKNALWSVLLTADRLDDELQKKFGGKRYVDAD
jgi:hypothetical protein